MANRQDEIDRLIEEVHAGASPDRGEHGDEASARCELVVAEGDQILILTELPPMKWSPDLVDEIADDLDENRVEELRAGSPLTPGETALWEAAWSDMAFSGTITVEIYRVIHSQRPELRAYVGWHYGASGQMQDELAWIGPLRDVEELPAFAIAQSEEWATVGLTFDPIDILEIDRITDEDAQSDRWDEVDRTQADIVFQAVKADRAARVRSAFGSSGSAVPIEQ